MGGHLVEAEGLEVVMCEIEDRSAGSFVDAAALHADETVFDDIEQPYAVLAAEFIEGEDDVLCAHFLAVEGGRDAFFKIECDICGLIGSVHRGDPHFKEAGLFVLRLVSGILKIKSFMRKMPQVFVF